MATQAPSNAHNELGKRGEDLAAQYLQTLGLVVLCRNWRCRDGEVDILLTDGTQLVACEVKTRTSAGFGIPAEAVDEEKARRVRLVATKWLSSFRVPWTPIRGDIVAIIWPPRGRPRIEHLPGAF